MTDMTSQTASFSYPDPRTGSIVTKSFSQAWPLPEASGLPTVNDWADLSALEPAAPGAERLVINGIPGASISGRVLARRGASLWGIPGADTTTIAYLGAHPIPAPTSYNVVEWAGTSVGHTLDTVANYLASHSMAGNTMTIAVSVVNLTGQTQDHIAIGICSGADVSGTFKVRVKNGTDQRNAAATWANLTFGGQATTRVTKVPISWSPVGGGDEPLQGRYVQSDLVALPSPVAPGDSVTFWIVTSTANAGEVVPDCEGMAIGADSDLITGLSSIGAGDGISGTVSSWDWTGHPIGLSKVVWGRTSSTRLVPIICVGDSTTAMFPGGGSDRRGWQIHASALAAASGKHVRYGGLGISSDLMESIAARAIDVVPVVAAAGGVLALQVLSWNSRFDYMGALTNLASVKTACDAAGVKLLPYVTAPPGSEQPYQADPWAHPQSSDQLAAYASAKATLLANYPYTIDMSVPVTSGTDYNHSDSTDDVHALLGSSSSQVGQYKMAQTLDGAILASLAALGVPT